MAVEIRHPDPARDAAEAGLPPTDVPGAGTTAAAPPLDVPLAAAPPATTAPADLLDAFLAEAGPSHILAVQPARYAAGRAIVGADRATKAAVLRAAVARFVGLGDAVGEISAAIARVTFAEARALVERRDALIGSREPLRGLVGRLVRQPPALTDAELLALVECLGTMSPHSCFSWSWLPVHGLARLIAREAAGRAPTPALVTALTRTRAAFDAQATTADERRAVALLDEALATLSGTGPADVPPIDGADDWGRAAVALLPELPAESRAAWLALLAHAGRATASKPTTTWQRSARAAVDALGEARFAELARAWLGLLHGPISEELRVGTGVGMYAGQNEVPRAVPTERNAAVLTGLLWCCSLVPDDALARAVADATDAAFRKIRNVGARSTKVGNAGLYALAALPPALAAPQLVRLRRSITQPSARARLEAAIDEVAARSGMTRDRLEDAAVEDGPLDPAERRAALAGQRDRLERLPQTDITWPLAEWRAAYLDHSLRAELARTLIWCFAAGERAAEGCWLDGRIVGVGGDPLDWLTGETSVAPWHPLGAPPERVLAWRGWLAEHGVTQPFKQAHREVYLLTDAERAAVTASARFADHVLSQHQLRALCVARGWEYQLHGQFDNGAGGPTLKLPRHGLRAELDVEPIEDNDERVSHAGIFLYVRTGAVRFYREVAATPETRAVARASKRAARDRLDDLVARGHRYDASGELVEALRAAYAPLRDLEQAAIGERGPLPLEQIPPIVLSEVFRDVDLFVAVSSIGADPAWLDRGPARYAPYWREFAFGELSTSAAGRRAALAELLPRLAIGERCSLTDRFLVVRGDLRTYKIHLGSGNILMEPNDQYLCIVPRREPETPATAALPFAGDHVLSVILSKALLLARDTAIKDPTIRRQIERQ